MKGHIATSHTQPNYCDRDVRTNLCGNFITWNFKGVMNCIFKTLNIIFSEVRLILHQKHTHFDVISYFLCSLSLSFDGLVSFKTWKKVLHINFQHPHHYTLKTSDVEKYYMDTHVHGNIMS